MNCDARAYSTRTASLLGSTVIGSPEFMEPIIGIPISMSIGIPIILSWTYATGNGAFLLVRLVCACCGSREGLAVIALSHLCTGTLQ